MIKHTIRTKEGYKEVNLTPLSAIYYNCKECLGFPQTTEKCTSPNCALYPFRTGDGKIGKKQVIRTKEQKEAFRDRMKASKASKSRQ